MTLAQMPGDEGQCELAFSNPKCSVTCLMTRLNIAAPASLMAVLLEMTA